MFPTSNNLYFRMQRYCFYKYHVFTSKQARHFPLVPAFSTADVKIFILITAYSDTDDDKTNSQFFSDNDIQY